MIGIRRTFDSVQWYRVSLFYDSKLRLFWFLSIITVKLFAFRDLLVFQMRINKKIAS